ncbi:hypothetical protein PVAND_017400 [Polypedilum vanderplanki]|uniref:C2H2-type domain-containing protein n=1 Tax=Polypedilum vanderplanki TaxID=319348 RepID=A0A9J6BHZ0_POLVA|nr:hypothetical protein PVAND_017400 [Polypedilum vanderplanki]
MSSNANVTTTTEIKSDLNRDFLLMLNEENLQQNVEREKEQNQYDQNDENFRKFCKKKFNSKYYLMQHMKILHSSEISLPVYSCDHCPKKFLKKWYLIKHLKSKYPKGKEIKFECDFDGKIFATKAKLYVHMTACHQIVEECKKCGKKVKNIKRHMQLIHLSEDKMIQCQICNKTCKNQTYLTIHMETHIKKYQCQVCGRKFALKYKFKEHQKIHENQFAYQCEICQKKINSSSNLKRHLKTHDKNRIKEHKCQQCSFSTDHKRDFTRHSKTHQKYRIKNLKCSICNYKTDQQGHLKNHLQIHNPNRPKFPCLYCNFEAAQRYSLKNHLKTHDPNRIKQFKCTYCKFDTDEKRSLTRHLNAKHNKKIIQ